MTKKEKKDLLLNVFIITNILLILFIAFQTYQQQGAVPTMGKYGASSTTPQVMGHSDGEINIKYDGTNHLLGNFIRENVCVNDTSGNWKHCPTNPTLDCYIEENHNPAAPWGSIVQATCNPGYQIMGGGCKYLQDELYFADYPSANSWICHTDQQSGPDDLTAYAICCRLT